MLDEKQIEILRAMTPGKKLEISLMLYWSARNLKRAALRKHNPELTDEEIDTMVKEIFMYAIT